MEYKYKYRIGLLIMRKHGVFDTITSEDMVNLYKKCPKISFEPIILTKDIFKAFGFRKSIERIGAFHVFSKYPVQISMKPFTDRYYCINVPSNLEFRYLHELQDFFSFYSTCKQNDLIEYMNFVTNYGSKYLLPLDS